MAISEQAQKYLKLARRAREENNSEDAKKYYDMLRAEDPDNAEARCFYPIYRLWDSKKGEWHNVFADLCSGVPSAIRAIAESEDMDDAEKAALLMAYIGEVSGLPTVCVKILNELNHEGSHTSQIRRSGRTGMEMLYNFGNSVEKYFSGKPEAMKAAVAAWKAGVSHQQKWYGMGLDKTLPDKYTEKIKAFEPSYEKPKKAGCISFGA